MYKCYSRFFILSFLFFVSRFPPLSPSSFSPLLSLFPSLPSPIQGPPGSVIPRALVLLECSLFVSKLNNEELTAWMKNQPGKYAANWELFRAFKSWGEAIGEALSACEITEKEVCVYTVYMYIYSVYMYVASVMRF